MENFDFITPNAAATMLGVHPDSVRRWIRNGKLKAFRIKDGGKLLIKKCDLNELIKPINA